MGRFIESWQLEQLDVVWQSEISAIGQQSNLEFDLEFGIWNLEFNNLGIID